ncbi:hypothetical protein [Sphingomonas sp. GB1N7]
MTIIASRPTVIPAQAGIAGLVCTAGAQNAAAPAFAGVTGVSS